MLLLHQQQECHQGTGVLQGIYDQRQRTEHEMLHREQEIKQLQGWAQTVHSLQVRIEDAVAQSQALAEHTKGETIAAVHCVGNITACNSAWEMQGPVTSSAEHALGEQCLCITLYSHILQV